MLVRMALSLITLLILLSACGVSDTTPASTPTPVKTTPGQTHTAGDYDQSLQSGNRKRTFQVHLPPAITGQKPLPLVLVFHGGGGNGDNIARVSEMSAKADKEGFIAVYPDGSGLQSDKLLTWNGGFCCGYALDKNIDDTGFIRSLIEYLEKTYPVDSKRIYATGMSNGGIMSYRLGVTLADKIAAIAPISAAMNGSELQPSGPVSVIAFNGLKDEHVPYDGGPSKKAVVKDAMQGEFKPVSYAISYWVKNDAASPISVREDKGNIIIDTYKGGKNGTEVVLYTLKNGGHAWPGGVKGSVIGDDPTNEISATDIMWEFFKNHPKL
jgi:polyhydroxybutyrate depolymerase